MKKCLALLLGSPYPPTLFTRLKRRRSNRGRLFFFYNSQICHRSGKKKNCTSYVRVFFFYLQFDRENCAEAILKEQQHVLFVKMLVFVLPTRSCCPLDVGIQQQLPILSGRSRSCENESTYYLQSSSRKTFLKEEKTENFKKL